MCNTILIWRQYYQIQRVGSKLVTFQKFSRITKEAGPLKIIARADTEILSLQFYDYNT